MEKPICNVHVHIFNAQYVPSNFVGQFFSFLSKFLTSTLKKKRPSKILIGILNLFPNGNQLKKYVSILRVGIKESQYRIFHNLRNTEGYPEGTRFVVLPLNFKYMGAGTLKDGSYEQQLDDLVKVAASSEGTLLPFVYIDPRMGTKEENLEFVKRYIEMKGFIGIKLYPALGYFPYDPRLELVYKWADEMNIPILTHCSSGGVFFNDKDNVEQFRKSISFNPQNINILDEAENKRRYEFDFPPRGVRSNKHYMERFADNFIRPVNYTDILEKYKNLKICFAHFGLDNNQLKKDFNLDWHEEIKKMMQMYPNVYTDISYSLYHREFMKKFVSYMDDKRLISKILYGTDFFMTLQEVKTENELYQTAVKDFGEHFEKIAKDNIEKYLSSNVYQY